MTRWRLSARYPRKTLPIQTNFHRARLREQEVLRNKKYQLIIYSLKMSASVYAEFNKPNQLITFKYPFVCTSTVSFNAALSVAGNVSFLSNLNVAGNATVTQSLNTGAITGLNTVLPVNAFTTAISNILTVGGPTIMYDKLTLTHPVGQRFDEALELKSNDGSNKGGVALYHSNDGVLQINGLTQFAATYCAGNVGFGLTAPQTPIHVRGNTAIARIDRDTNAPILQLHSYPPGNYTTPYKGFGLGVLGTAANTGSFFIGDYGTATTGNAAARLLIDTNGNVGVNTISPMFNLDVNGTANVSGNLAAGALNSRIFQGPIIGTASYSGPFTSAQTIVVCNLPDSSDLGFFELTLSVQVQNTNGKVVDLAYFHLYSLYSEYANDNFGGQLVKISSNPLGYTYNVSNSAPTLTGVFNLYIVRNSPTLRTLNCYFKLDDVNTTGVKFRVQVKKLDSVYQL